MRTRLFFFLLGTVILAAGLSARQWRDVEGRAVSGEMIQFKDGYIYLQVEGSEVINGFPLDRLSVGDQIWVYKQSGLPLPEPLQAVVDSVPSAFWVLFGSDGTRGGNDRSVGEVRISADGKEWRTVFTGGANEGTNNHLTGFVVGNGVGLAYGFGDNFFLVDPALNFEKLENPPRGMGNFLYDGERFVGIGVSQMATSTDGRNWERVRLSDVALPQGNRNIRAAAYGAGKLVVVGDQRRGVIENGDWVHHEILPQADGYRLGASLVFGNNVFGCFKRESFLRTVDGVSWTSVDFGEALASGAQPTGQLWFSGDSFYAPVNRGRDGVELLKSHDLTRWEVALSVEGYGRFHVVSRGKAVFADSSQVRFLDLNSRGEAVVEVDLRQKMIDFVSW